MSAGPGVAPANSAKFRFIVAKAAVSTLICSRLGGRPPAAAGAAAAAVLVPGMTVPVIRARRGSDGGTGRRVGGPIAPAWADGSNNAAISAAAVIGNVRVSSALRMYLLLRASLGRRLVAAGRLHPAWARPRAAERCGQTPARASRYLYAKRLVGDDGYSRLELGCGRHRLTAPAAGPGRCASSARARQPAR